MFLLLLWLLPVVVTLPFVRGCVVANKRPRKEESCHLLFSPVGGKARLLRLLAASC